jgi:hypothetical protein
MGRGRFVRMARLVWSHAAAALAAAVLALPLGGTAPAALRAEWADLEIGGIALALFIEGVLAVCILRLVVLGGLEAALMRQRPPGSPMPRALLVSSLAFLALGLPLYLMGALFLDQGPWSIAYILCLAACLTGPHLLDLRAALARRGARLPPPTRT